MRALLVLVALAGTAYAHQTSVKYVDLQIDGSRVAISVEVAPGDVTEPLALPADSKPSAGDAATPAVARYVAAWLDVRGCAPGDPHAEVDDKFVKVAWTVACADRVATVTLDFTRFFAIDRKHEAIVRLSAPGSESVNAIVRASSPIVTMTPGEPPSFLTWVSAGVDHIWSGVDHELFVLALLLVVMLERGKTWTLRSPLASLRRTAGVITGFTLAHSISLALASLDVIRLPARPVETMIAVSIIYTVIEDVAYPQSRWRFALAFGFGLVHGLGFANVLIEMLPPSDVALPLLGFNVGVELGQLAIVLVALPLLWLLAWVVGASAYRRYALPILATLILLPGIGFLLARAFDFVLVPGM